MRHENENTLGLYAIDPALVPERADLEAHLSTCEQCRKLLESIRLFDASLRDPETWLDLDPPGSGATLEELQAFAERRDQEDQEALKLLVEFEDPDSEARLPKLLTSFVWTDPSRRPLYQTGGVARRLCKLAHGMCERKPLYALALAEAATAISMVLPASTYPRNSIHELRGEAWKEQANALHHLGRLTDALGALEEAEMEYRQLPHSGLGIVAVNYVRAAVFYEQEQLDIAEPLARDAAVAALHLGAIDHHMRARHLQGEIRFERQQFADAAELFASILSYGETRNDHVWIARESLTLGNCYIEMRDLDRATSYLSRASALFSDMQLSAELTRTEWALARLQFLRGNTDTALHQLRAVVESLTGHGMLTDAAIAATDLAEILNQSERGREIPKLLSGVVRTFTEAGKLTGALTALAYLKEASAANAVLPPQVFAHVRKFLARSDHRADLLFAPPSG